MAVSYETSKSVSDLLTEAEDKAIENAIIAAFGEEEAKLLAPEREARLKAALKNILKDAKESQRAELLRKKIALEKQIKDLKLSEVFLALLPVELILQVDEVSERKNRDVLLSKLKVQDAGVSNEFGIQVATQFEANKARPNVGANKFASSGAIILGGTCLGIGVWQIVAAGSIVAAGAFPIGLVVLGAALIVGAGIYYAYKKRARIARFLPALYEKAKNKRELRIAQLEGTERQRKIKDLKSRYKADKEENQKNNEEAYKRQKDKVQGKLDNLEGKILEHEETVRVINLILRSSFSDEKFKATFGEKIKNILGIKTIDNYTVSEILKYLRTKSHDLKEVELPECKRERDTILESLETLKAEQAEKMKKESQAFKEELGLLERKSVGLRWYKKIIPYFSYLGTRIAINFKSYSAASSEFSGAVLAGIAKAKEVQQSRSGGAPIPPALDFLQSAEDSIQRFEAAKAQFEQRVAGVVNKLGEFEDINSGFADYLQIEEAYPLDYDFEEKIKKLNFGGSVRNILLKIFYTHPSTVLSLLDTTTEKTKKNITKVFEDVEYNLLQINVNLQKINEMQVYFPANNNANNERFMLVAEESHVALFNNVLLIKQGIMEINKTIGALSSDELEAVKAEMWDKLSGLIKAAVPTLRAVEKQFENLDAEEETNKLRAAYLFADVKVGGSLDDYMLSASVANLILLLDEKYLVDFVGTLKKPGAEPAGLLKKFIDLYKPDAVITNNEKLALFQGFSNPKNETERNQLESIKKAHDDYIRNQRQRIGYRDLKKLNGSYFKDENDFIDYVKKNQHIYSSQKVLIDQKRGVLEEMQKALVLSVPEMANTLRLDLEEPTFNSYRDLCQKRRVRSYGVPYNPASSISIDYILNLFKKARNAIKGVRRVASSFSSTQLTVDSLSVNLDEILKLVDDPTIPDSVKNAQLVLDKLRTASPTFATLFGSTYEKIRRESEVFNTENQGKIVDMLKALKEFLVNIPLESKGSSFKDLFAKIQSLSTEMSQLKSELMEKIQAFNPSDPEKVKGLDSLIERLEALKSTIDLDKLQKIIESESLSAVFRDFPAGFPGKDKLLEFSQLFEENVQKGLIVINENLQIAELAKLTRLVGVIKNMDPNTFQQDLEDLLARARALASDVREVDLPEKFIEDAKEKLLALSSVKSRLLELQKLMELPSEISNIDFTKPPYASVLNSLGLSKAKIDSFIEKVQDVPRASSDALNGSLKALGLAEIPFKWSLLLENVQVVLLHCDLDSEDVDYLEFFNAIKDAQKIYDELLILNVDETGLLKTSLSEINKHFVYFFDEAMRYTKSMGDQMASVVENLVGEDRSLIESLTSKNATLISKFEDYHKMIKILDKYKSNLKSGINNDESLRELMALNPEVFNLEFDVSEFSKLKEEVRAALSDKQPSIPVLEEFLSVLDQFYGLNSQEEIRQNIEFAKSISPDNTHPLIFSGPEKAAEKKKPVQRKKSRSEAKRK